MRALLAKLCGGRKAKTVSRRKFTGYRKNWAENVLSFPPVTLYGPPLHVLCAFHLKMGLHHPEKIGTWFEHVFLFADIIYSKMFVKLYQNYKLFWKKSIIISTHNFYKIVQILSLGLLNAQVSPHLNQVQNLESII